MKEQSMSESGICCTSGIDGTIVGNRGWERVLHTEYLLGINTYSSNYHTIALISHASKVMLKILQARLQQYVNRELPDVQAGFRKGGGTRDQIANIWWIIKKA